MKQLCFIFLVGIVLQFSQTQKLQNGNTKNIATTLQNPKLNKNVITTKSKPVITKINQLTTAKIMQNNYKLNPATTQTKTITKLNGTNNNSQKVKNVIPTTTVVARMSFKSKLSSTTLSTLSTQYLHVSQNLESTTVKNEIQDILVHKAVDYDVTIDFSISTIRSGNVATTTVKPTVDPEVVKVVKSRLISRPYYLPQIHAFSMQMNMMYANNKCTMQQCTNILKYDLPYNETYVKGLTSRGTLITECSNNKKHFFISKQEIMHYKSYELCCEFGMKTARVVSHEEIACLRKQYEVITGKAIAKQAAYNLNFVDKALNNHFVTCPEDATISPDLWAENEPDNNQSGEECTSLKFGEKKTKKYLGIYDVPCNSNVFGFCQYDLPESIEEEIETTDITSSGPNLTAILTYFNNSLQLNKYCQCFSDCLEKNMVEKMI